jgi:single stranded DNA-binding protein
MQNKATIEIIGNVGKDPLCPKPFDFPNFVVFSVGVSRSWKDKNNTEQKETIWFNCQSSAEIISNIIKQTVKRGALVSVKGYPKPNAFLNKEGQPQCSIEIKVTDVKILNNDKKGSFEQQPLTYDDKGLLDDDIPF